MAKLSNIKRIIKEDFEKEYHKLIDRLGYILNTFMEESSAQINGNLDYTNLNQDRVIVKMTISKLTHTRVEFQCEFVNAANNALIAKGSQAVVWINPQRRTSFMPDELYNKACEFFNITPE